MNSYYEELDKLVVSSLETIKQRVGLTNYNKIEGIIKGLLSEAEYCGEYTYQLRAEESKKLTNKANVALDEQIKKKAENIRRAKELQAKGKSSKEIAGILGIDVKSVRNYLYNEGNK